MKKVSIIAVALAAALCGGAQASTIKVEAADGVTTGLTTGADYQNAVDGFLAGPDYTSALLPSYDFVTHHDLFGGVSNFSMKSTIDFGVVQAGNWSFRAGVDFGYGAAMFLDGVAVDVKANYLWWEGDWNAGANGVLSATQLLATGNHTLTIYGMEDCCDGGQAVQFAAPQGQFVSFSSGDGLAPLSVPEPASLALVFAGMGMLGLSRRRARK
jgi:hypothetical protein